MAKSQIEPVGKSLEMLLAEANAEALRPPESPLIDPTDINAVKAMVWGKLVQIAATITANDKALPILREIMDRLEGRPRQQIDTTMKGEMTTTIQIVRFSDLKTIDQQTQDVGKLTDK